MDYSSVKLYRETIILLSLLDKVKRVVHVVVSPEWYKNSTSCQPLIVDLGGERSVTSHKM